MNKGYTPPHIKKSHLGLFTKEAEAHGQTPVNFAMHVLHAPKGQYSGAVRKRANFVHNFDYHGKH
jgi:hypothetical protein